MKVEEKWRKIVRDTKVDYLAVAKELKVNPVVVKTLHNRGLDTVEQMKDFMGLSDFHGHDGSTMKDLVPAANMLVEFFKKGSRIRIVGDYDVDGITSTYTLYNGLTRINGLYGGKSMIDFEIPDRINDGYGINKRIVQSCADDGVEVIVTCDNGIAAIEALTFAKELGLIVIVTDHHSLKEELPPADLIVNPHQTDCPYPYEDICGAVVAFRLIEYLYKMHNLEGEIDRFYPYVALGTVCDVMPLVDENRYIVRHGLEILRNQMDTGTVDVGLNALLEQTEVTSEKLDAFTFGFIIGPCLNATGRLGSATVGFYLLEEKDPMKAAEMAGSVKELNDERKELCAKYEEKAKELAFSDEYKDDKVLVVFLDGCHESIAGIVAGRLREATGRPTLVATTSEKDPSIAKGSGRSTPEYHMFNKLSEVEDLFVGFGGHPGAAGFSLKKENLDKLRKELNARAELSDEDVAIKRDIDMVMPMKNVSLSMVPEFDKLKPFGMANPKPLIAATDVEIVGLKIVGKKNNVLQIQMQADGKRFKGVYFGANPLEIFKIYEEETGVNIANVMNAPHLSIRCNVIYFPKLNEWNGNVSVDFTISGIKFRGIE